MGKNYIWGWTRLRRFRTFTFCTIFLRRAGHRNSVHWRILSADWKPKSRKRRNNSTKEVTWHSEIIKISTLISCTHEFSSSKFCYRYSSTISVNTCYFPVWLEDRFSAVDTTIISTPPTSLLVAFLLRRFPLSKHVVLFSLPTDNIQFQWAKPPWNRFLAVAV